MQILVLSQIEREVNFYVAITLAPLSASFSLSLSLSLYVCEYKLRALWYVLYSVLPRASSRPLTPTNRRGRKASETFFYPYAILSLFEGFYYGYSNVVFSPCRGQAHPVTPTSLPAWIWDTADRKKLNGRIIFWKGHTRP